MIGAALAQTSTTPGPTCPATADEANDNQRLYSKWLRADWNGDRWEIDCGSSLSNAANATYNMANALPSRTPARSRFNSNYGNTNRYIFSNVNVAVNAIPARRTQSKRRPGP